MPESGQNRRFTSSMRLKTTADFQKVRVEGSSYQGKLMVLGVRFRRGEPHTTARLGLVTTRRTGNAVARNRIRRRLREIFRKHREALDQKCDIVVIARKAAAEAAFSELESEWVRLARRARILHPA